MNSHPLGCAGHTWSGLTVVHGESSQSKHVTIGNPAPIVDMATGRVHMLFSRNNKEVGVLSSDDNVRPVEVGLWSFHAGLCEPW